MDNLRDYRAEQIAREAAKRLDMTNGTESRTNGITSGATLLPCPFCEGEGYVTAHKHGYYPTAKHDRDCVMAQMGLPETDFYIKPEFAARAWNTREQTVFGITLDEVRQMMKRDAERIRNAVDNGD